MITNLFKRSVANGISIALLIVYSYAPSFAQERVLVHEFKLLNESPEELPGYGSFLRDSVFVKPILEVLEKGIRSKVGELPIDYYSGPQIDQLSLKVNPYRNSKEQFKEYLAQQKAYNTRFRKDNRKSHQFIVKVEAEFLEPGAFQSQENVRFRLKVRIREKENGKVFSGKVNYYFNVHTPDLLMAELSRQSPTLYQNFPLSKEEIQQAYITGIQQIFFNEESSKNQFVNRSIYKEYDNFIHQAARKYNLIVPVTYGYSTLSNVKYRFLGIPVIAGKSTYSDLLAGEQSSPKRGRIQIRERRLSGLSDMDFNGQLGIGFRKFNRTFLLSSELFPAPYSTYYLKGAIRDVYALGVPIGNPFNNGFKLNLYNEEKLLKSDMNVYNLGVTTYDEGVEESVSSSTLGPLSRTKTNGGAKSLHKMLRNYGRIYTPYVKAEGNLLGKPYTLITNPLCLNNVELYYGDEMIGLITHSKPTKKQLKKKKHVIPHTIYLKGGLSTEEEALILQSFQLMRVGYAMNSMHRGKSRRN